MFGRHSTWPNSADSVGDFLMNIDGRNKCWRAVGPVRHIFQDLGEKIKAHLNKCIESIPGSDFVTLSIYMVGPTEQRASPVVMFFSENAQERKKAQEAVKKSGLLQNYAGMRTGHRASAPDIDKLEQFTRDIDPQPVSGGTEDHRLILIISTSTHEISAQVRNGAAVSVRKGTLGGVVKRRDLNDNEHSYIFTAGHILTENIPSSSPGIPKEAEYDWEIDSDGDMDIEMIDAEFNEDISPGSPTLIDVHSQVSECSHGSSSSSPGVLGMSVSITPATAVRALLDPPRQDTLPPINVSIYAIEDSISALDVGQLHEDQYIPAALAMTQGELAVFSADLDYALIKLQDASFLGVFEAFHYKGVATTLSSASIIHRVEEDVRVVTLTATNGIVEGHLDGTPAYSRLPNGRNFEKLYTIRTNTLISKGVCGSWVFNLDFKAVYGHVVAGSLQNGTAYIVPAHNVLEDLRKWFGDLPLWFGSFVPGLDQAHHVEEITVKTEQTSENSRRVLSGLKHGPVESFSHGLKRDDLPEAETVPWMLSTEDAEDTADGDILWNDGEAVAEFKYRLEFSTHLARHEDDTSKSIYQIHQEPDPLAALSSSSRSTQSASVFSHPLSISTQLSSVYGGDEVHAEPRSSFHQQTDLQKQHVTSIPGTTARERGGGRTGPLSQAQKQQASEVRKLGACLRCTIMREKASLKTVTSVTQGSRLQCSLETPCKTCSRKPRNRPRVWSGVQCIRRFLDWERIKTTLIPGIFQSVPFEASTDYLDELTFQLRTGALFQHIATSSFALSSAPGFRIPVDLHVGTLLYVLVKEFSPLRSDFEIGHGFRSLPTDDHLNKRFVRVRHWNPPIVMLIAKNSGNVIKALQKNILNIVDEVTDEPERFRGWTTEYFEDREQDFQTTILGLIGEYYKRDMEEHDILKTGLRLLWFDYLLRLKFIIPSDAVADLEAKLESTRPPEVSGDVFVVPDLINRFLKAVILPMAEEAAKQVAGHLHEILYQQAVTQKLSKARTDTVLCLLFVLMIFIGRVQEALLLLASIPPNEAETEYSLQLAEAKMREMEQNLVDYFCGFHKYEMDRRKSKAKPSNQQELSAAERHAVEFDLAGRLREVIEEYQSERPPSLGLPDLDIGTFLYMNVRRLCWRVWTNVEETGIASDASFGVESGASR